MPKEKQSEAIKSIYEGKDVFTWLPTGYGKSLRYQLLLYLFGFKLGRTRAIATERSVALVISPLVSLMVDQVCILQAHGVCAAILSGNTGVRKALLATERGQMCPHTLSVYSLHERLHHCQIFYGVYTENKRYLSRMRTQ